MTDITELAQEELAQLRGELSNEAIDSKDHLRKIALSLVDKLEKCRDREIRWLALSDEKSKIIADQEEALEKAQQRIAELENYAEAESAGADRAAEDSVYWMKRCKELESRTVKLPHRNLGHPKLFLLCPFPYYDAEDMEKALADAGIKWEAE